jgi:cell division inhibitor SepF
MATKFVDQLWKIIGLVPEADMSEEQAIDKLYEDLDSQEIVEHDLERRVPENVRTVGNAAFSMKLVKPKTHVEAQVIIDCLKNKQPVIVNLEANDVEEGQRVIDFVSGAVYALGGEVKHISKRIFAIVPENIGFAE